MDISTKSVAYSFIAEGANIFLSESDYFLVSKLICLKCGADWYMDITECLFCGTLNPFLYYCYNCNKYQSIAKKGKCIECEGTLVKKCCNDECITNQNYDIFKEKGGVFGNNVKARIAMQYCLNCGSNHHKYETFKIFLKRFEKDEFYFEDLGIKKRDISNNSRLLIKYKPGADPPKYRIYKFEEIYNGDLIKITNLTDNFTDIYNELFKIKSE